MITEDDVARQIRAGEMDVAGAVQTFAGDVVVYPAVGVVEGTETWADVEAGAGSSLFHDLQRAGATPDQLSEIGANIERLRAQGRTMDKVFAWPEAAMTPEGDPAPPTLTAIEPEAEPSSR